MSTLIRVSMLMLPDMVEWIDAQIASGRFETRSQVIRYYLRAQMPQGDKRQ